MHPTLTPHKPFFLKKNNLMEHNNSPKRRASEPGGGEALALVSSTSVYNRIPTPLPYLPSDYRPSPDSPRHFLGPQPFEPSTKRQRSHSIGHPLAIEHEQQQQQQQFELVPYRDWAVIA